MEDVFLKFALLNKSFFQILEKLKTFPKLWKIKFVQEFTNNKDRLEKRYTSAQEQEAYFNVFNDNRLQEGQTTFDFFKKSIEKQLMIKDAVIGVITETNEQMYKNRMRNVSHPSSEEHFGIMNFIRPYNKRHEFCPRDATLPEDVPFELLVFFRTFFNPDLDGFSRLKLHQYHILFQLLEHELRFMETELQGINLKYVLFSALTCSNMSKFLK